MSAKTKAARAAAPRRKSVPSPADLPVAGTREYLEVTKVLLEVVPARKPGLALGEVFDAVRAGTSRKEFPGDTYRMWAKQALLDLAARGVLVEDGGSPSRWRRV